MATTSSTDLSATFDYNAGLELVRSFILNEIFARGLINAPPILRGTGAVASPAYNLPAPPTLGWQGGYNNG